MPQQKEDALLVRLGGLGDGLAALPSIRLLRSAFPGMALALLGRLEYGRLLLERGVVDAVYSADDTAWLSLFGPTGMRVPAGAEDLSQFSFKLGWFLTPAAARPFLPGGSASSGLSPWQIVIYDPAAGLPVSRFFYSATRTLVGGRVPAAATYEDFIRLPGASDSPRTRFALIHPGSGSIRKCWPLDRFFAAASFLRDRGIDGAFVIGEAEERLAEHLTSVALPAGWRLLRRPSLSDLARMLESAALYIGNDSGVTHLAAACGTPAIALFLTENVAAWRPSGRTVVLSASTMDGLKVDEVQAALLRTSIFSPSVELC